VCYDISGVGNGLKKERVRVNGGGSVTVVENGSFSKRGK